MTQPNTEHMKSAEAVAREIMRELDDSMKSPRMGGYFQGDVADPHRSCHIVERHVALALRAARAEVWEEVIRKHERLGGGEAFRIWLEDSRARLSEPPRGHEQ